MYRGTVPVARLARLCCLRTLPTKRIHTSTMSASNTKLNNIRVAGPKAGPCMEKVSIDSAGLKGAAIPNPPPRASFCPSVPLQRRCSSQTTLRTLPGQTIPPPSHEPRQSLYNLNRSHPAHHPPLSTTQLSHPPLPSSHPFSDHPAPSSTPAKPPASRVTTGWTSAPTR